MLPRYGFDENNKCYNNVLVSLENIVCATEASWTLLEE